MAASTHLQFRFDDQVGLQTKLSCCHSCGSAVVGLDVSCGDKIAATFIDSISQQKLQLSDLIKQMTSL